MAKPKKPKEKLHMGTISDDVNLLSDSSTEKICKSLRIKKSCKCCYEEPYAGKPHVRFREDFTSRGVILLDYNF